MRYCVRSPKKGILVYTTAALTAFATDGEIDLHEGEVSLTGIGANAQTSAFDLERLQDRVLYLDSTFLPVPEFFGGLGP